MFQLHTQVNTLRGHIALQAKRAVTESQVATVLQPNIRAIKQAARASTKLKIAARGKMVVRPRTAARLKRAASMLKRHLLNKITAT